MGPPTPRKQDRGSQLKMLQGRSAWILHCLHWQGKPIKQLWQELLLSAGHLRGGGKAKLNIQKSQGNLLLKTDFTGNSLAVHWLGLGTFTAEGLGSIPGQGNKIPQATHYGQNKNKNRLYRARRTPGSLLGQREKRQQGQRVTRRWAWG